MSAARMPVVMGLAMGLMLPWMMHIEGAGLGFLLAHVAVLGAIAAVALAFPALRHRLHRPSPRHLATMLPGLALGWGATCLYCLATDGHHWS